METPHLASPRPASARGLPLTLDERVALYCHQSTAANNAGVLRNVPKPTADEIAEFLEHSVNLYDNAALVRLLLTDSDYDTVCRDVLSLQEAIAWHAKQPHLYRKEDSATSLGLLLMSAHVFGIDEVRAAHALAVSCGLDDVIPLFPESVRTAKVPEQVHVKTKPAEAPPHTRREEESTTQSDAVETGNSIALPAVEETRNDGSIRLAEDSCGLPQRHESVTAMSPELFLDAPLVVNVRSVESDSAPTANVLSIPEFPNVQESTVATHTVTRDRDSANTCPAELRSTTTRHDWVKEAAETTIHRAVTTGVQHVVSSQHPRSDDENHSISPAHEAVASQSILSVKSLPLEPTDTAVSKHELVKDAAETTVHQVVTISVQHIVASRHSSNVDEETSETPTETVLGIEAIVHTLDAALVERDEKDPDELAFGEDASLLDDRTMARVVETETNTILTGSRRDSPTNALENANFRPTTDEVPSHSKTGLLQVGDAIEARYRGTMRYYSGTITAVHAVEGTYDVAYDDGDTESHVRSEWIRRVTSNISTSTVAANELPTLDVHRVGDAVEARYRGLNKFFRGEIAAVVGNGRYDIRYADGEYESDVSSEYIRPLGEKEPRNDRIPDAKAVESEPQVVTATAGERPQERQGVDAATCDRSDTVKVATVKYIGGSLAETQHPTSSPGGSDRLSDATERSRSETIEIEPAAEIAPLPRQEDATASAEVDRRPLEREARTHAVARRQSSRASEIRSTKGGNNSDAWGNQVVETTPVVPFKRKTPSPRIDREHDEFAAIAAAEALLSARDDDDDDDDGTLRNDPVDLSDEDDNDDDEAIAVESILHATTQLQTVPTRSDSFGKPHSETTTSSHDDTKRPSGPNKKKRPPASHEPMIDPPPRVPVLSAATLRYLSPHSRPSTIAKTPRPKSSDGTSTPRAGVARRRDRPVPAQETVSWKELEEWKNVDLILNRKRRVVVNGTVGGTDVPWGEEFAAIQSLKRFAGQYPDVLRDHIACQLAEVVASDGVSGSSRSVSTHTTTAARDALLLIKDLTFVLRHRLAPFFDTILPVVLPAVFHLHKRFLCDAAYEVLEALVTHCSSRKLVVALLKQARRCPCGDLRLVNLTCLYVEKCLTALGVAAIDELLLRSGGAVLGAIAELLTRKSAACQSSLQKSLRMLELAIGEDVMDRLLLDHLMGNELALVRRHLVLADTTTHSPSASPKKLLSPQRKGDTPTKPTTANGGGSILQRMLAQRQNRVVPAPE